MRPVNVLNDNAPPVPAADARYVAVKAIAYYMHQQLSPFTGDSEPDTWMFEQALQLMAMIDASNKEAIRFMQEKTAEREKELEAANAAPKA